MSRHDLALILAIGPIIPIVVVLFYLKFRKVKSKVLVSKSAMFRTLNPFSPIDDSVPLKEDMWLIKVVLGIVVIWAGAIGILMKHWV